MYMSGSWQVGQFADLIGDAFDWIVVPNPCGPPPAPACPVAQRSSASPAPTIEEVARVMDYW